VPLNTLEAKQLIANDGDIIRGLGFITMHAAHLEGRVEDLLFLLSNIECYTEKEQRLPISAKIKKAKKTLSKLGHPLMQEIVDNLESCREHFEWRNELVHGRIFSPEYHKENLQSSRPNVPDRAASAEEIYRLANNLLVLNNKIYRAMIINLPRVIAELTSNA
jgi:hypothetical protein